MLKVITGNPGTGKHTIAKLVSKRLDLELIDINKVAISEGVFEKRKDTLDVDVKKLKKIIDKIGTRNSLLVGHLAPYVISKKNTEIVIVLRKSPYKLQNIYKKRGYAKKKAIENLGSEILGITYYDTIRAIGRRKTCQVDTSDRSIPLTANKVESIFCGIKSREDNVDWLQLVKKNGDMQKFFSY